MKLKLVPLLVGLSLCSAVQAEVRPQNLTFTDFCQKAVSLGSERPTLDALARLVSVRTPVEANTCEYLDGALASRTRYSLRGKKLVSLQAFAYLPQAKELIVSNNQIKDLTGLEALTQLETLDLGGNAIESIDELKGATALRVLRLQGNEISDLTALSGLSLLSDLSVGSNRLTDVKPLAKLGALEYVNLSSNALESLEGLESLPKLRVLNIGFNKLCESSFLTEAEKRGVTVIGQDTQACTR